MATTEPFEDSDLVDFDRLAHWMDGQGLEQGPIESPALLSGGSQNVIVVFHRAGRRFVLRRPSRYPQRDGNETMRREARILGALAGTDVPHARLIAACPDAEIIGAAFYLMEPIDGFNISVGMPALHAGNPAIRRRMGFAMAEALAALARVDHVAVGLQDLGKIDGFLNRQVARWLGQLDGYSRFEGWTGPAEIPHVDAVASWLNSNRPRSFRPGIMHGDFHIKNVMFRNDGPEVTAIIDWELATIGDPLIDLGWLVATWRGPGGETRGTPFIVEPWAGFPDPHELVARYGEKSGRDVSAIGWYAVFACFKLGIILEGSYARARAGKVPKATGDRLHTSAITLFERAFEWIGT